MNLNAYLAAERSLIATTASEANAYTDAMLAEGLRQALREYDQLAPPAPQVLDVAETGRALDIGGLAALRELVLVAWPWPVSPGGSDLRERVVRWSTWEPGKIWIHDGEPQAGDRVLCFYRRVHTVEELDGATATTVDAAHESLVVVGAAAWATELHYRQQAESIKGATPEQIKRMYTWSYLRLQEFRNGLKDIARSTPLLQPAWGEIGL